MKKTVLKNFAIFTGKMQACNFIKNRPQHRCFPLTWKMEMAEASTFFNEENMKVIRNIFKEEFEKQEKNIENLISTNFKITMEEIKKSQNERKNLGKEICDMRSSLDLTENLLEEKVKKLEERSENMEAELQEFYNNQIDPEYVYNKLVDLKDRSRRCNLWIDSVTERKGETLGAV